jgi:hypothetical protein
MAPTLNPQLPENKRKAFALLLESMLALRRENKEVLWSSMVKDTMKRKKPSFNENYHGYRTFSELLEDAQREGLLELDTDKRSRTYVVTRFGSEMTGPAATAAAAKAPLRRRRPARGRPPGEKPRRMLVEIPPTQPKAEAEGTRVEPEGMRSAPGEASQAPQESPEPSSDTEKPS